LSAFYRWDNGEWDRLSPWDLENIDPGRRPYETGASVQLLPVEISSTLYTPKTDDWPPQGDRDFECDRISEGISQVMSLPLAKHFSEPVNLELFPNYAFVVKYPVDLSTIKARLDHRFYRRAIAVEYDVRRIHTNALKFNDPEKSDIVRNSSIITDLCLEIIRNSDLDIKAFYLQLLEKYEVRGIKVKKSVPPNEKRQIEQSSSFALTFTNVVTGSNQTSASVQKSRPKLVFNSSQGSSSLVSSNRISVKVSSSFTVDEPISGN
jgi:bromodomain and WD repeat domain-containing protein 1/3